MAIHYVSSLATGGGTGAFVDPWTLQEGADGTLAGDECRIMADGTYFPTATINFDVNAGNAGSYPVFIGANSSGEIDKAMPVISGDSLPSGADIFYFNIAGQRFKLKYLDIINSKRYGVNGNSSNNVGYIECCNFTNCVSNGIYSVQSSSRYKVLGCSFVGNLVGYGSINSSRMQGGTVVGCYFSENTNSAIICAGDNNFTKNIFKRNGAGIIHNGAGLQRNNINNNVFFKNIGDAIQMNPDANDEQISIVENIFRSNGGYGLNTRGSDVSRVNLLNNCFSNNTAGNVDINSGVVWGDDNILEDPLFVSEVLDEEDFNLQSNSPCIGAGLNPVGY